MQPDSDVPQEALAGRLLIWKEPDTWYVPLTAWLLPYLRDGGVGRLQGARKRSLCWDDCVWRDRVLDRELDYDGDYVVEALGEDLKGATVRAYHGCRVADAGVFHREGLRLNDPVALEAEVRRIVAEEDALAWMRPRLEQHLAEFEHKERDIGCVYAVLDDRMLTDRAGHYALYGSEWMQVFFVTHKYVLRSRGVPTILEVDLPLATVPSSQREALASTLLQEWTRITVNSPREVPVCNFSFILREAVPARCVVGHYHPASAKCPYNGKVEFKSAVTTCPSC